MLSKVLPRSAVTVLGIAPAGFNYIQISSDHDTCKRTIYSVLGVIFILFLTASLAFSGDAKLTNLIVRNSDDQLQVDLMVKGIFTEEMKAVVSKGVPISLTFIILLYEVHDYWLDDKMVGKIAIHNIKFNALKKEYRVRRSWEGGIPTVIKDSVKARRLFSEVKGFDVIPLERLKKGKHYQLRVKSEISENKVHFTGFPWEFETDWYTMNFIF